MSLYLQREDLKLIDPAILDTPEECQLVMNRLDATIGNMKVQLKEAQADYHQGRAVNQDWYNRLNLAIKLTKVKRVAVQQRMAALNRARREANRESGHEASLRFERQFIIQAKRAISPDLYEQIIQATKEAVANG